MCALRKFLVFNVKALHVDKKDFENILCLVVGFIGRSTATIRQQYIANSILGVIAAEGDRFLRWGSVTCSSECHISHPLL
jgi:hypothetical protein